MTDHRPKVGTRVRLKEASGLTPAGAYGTITWSDRTAIVVAWDHAPGRPVRWNQYDSPEHLQRSTVPIHNPDEEQPAC